MSHLLGSVSLLIPCYNAESYMSDLLKSIEMLDTGFEEIIFYDDGSNDQTVKLIRQAGMTIIDGKENRGVAFARNRLMEHASCEWLHFQDADDPINPEFLNVMQPLLRSNIDVAVCDTDWIDDKSSERLIAWRYRPDALRADPLLSNLRMGIGCNSMVIRSQILADLGGFDETMRMWEDADLHIRLAAAGARYDALGAVAAISLRRDSSLSHDYRTSWNSRLAALERYAKTLPQRVLPEIAAQAEIAARELLVYHDNISAKRALTLNHQLGANAPYSRNPVIRVTHILLGAWAALRLQTFLRRRAA